MQLRDYQQECIDIIEQKPPGAYLVQMATGLGKTKTFTHLPRHGRVLILSHREELVKQPLKEYDCKTGVEMAKEHADPDAEVVSASVMSMAKRLLSGAIEGSPPQEHTPALWEQVLEQLQATTLTPDEALEALVEAGMLTPVADGNGAIYTDEDGNICCI